MSTKVMALCWPLTMKPTPKSVLISLADNASDEGHCWPSIDTICARTCFGRDAVIEAIAWLEQAGALKANRENGRRTSYVVTPETFDRSAAHVSRRSTSRANRPPPVGHVDEYQSGKPTAPVGQTDQSGKTDDQSGKTIDQSGKTVKPVGQTDTNRNEPSMNPKRTVKGRGSFDAKMMVLPEWLDAGLWTRWAVERAKRGKPITEEGARLQIQKLQELQSKGFSPASVIEPSIEHGWTGLFEPRQPIEGRQRRPTSHHGLASKNYSEGITPDGSFA